MKKALVFSLILAPVIAAIMVGITVSLIIHAPYTGSDQVFIVKQGEGFSSINYRLSKANLINNPRVFHYYTKFQDSMHRFKAGAYNITSGMDMTDILNTFVNGVPILIDVTVPEGKNMFEIGKILEEKAITNYEDFIKACRNPENIALIENDAPSVEGYLFPETYKFAPNTPADLVVRTMVNLFLSKTASLNFGNSTLSKHKTIILASIVEKETGAKWERPTIAGVYLNRLHRPMRLQADPTTIYGIWENFDGNLRKKHLLEKTAYNTYKIDGLPLGPIANPGLAAIEAVIKPKQHNFLYFVSKNDGTHIFTPTYKEHLKAVDTWQKNYRNRKGKSWRDLQQ